MDWKQILSLSNEELSDVRKEEIYQELVKDQKFDGKIAKKLFPLCLSVLKYKGDQVDKQREEIEMLDIDLKATMEQLERQKKLIGKYEMERTQYKTRVKDLTEEMALMHGREMQGSDEDSPDPLSEIDRQQELMGNISMKNKHIKRLLRDIEKLEDQCSTQIHVIKELKSNMDEASQKITFISNQLSESNTSMKYLEEKILKLQTKVQEQQIENNQLQEERQEKELEMESFSAQLEERIVMYKNVLDEKQKELEVVKRKYVDLVDQLPGINIDTDQCELNKLLKSIKERDEVIKTFEHKIGILSAELLDSTQVISKINNEKEDYMKKLVRDRNDQCCKEVKEMLDRSNIRGKELQEMLQLTENDNILKAQQAFEAIEMLRAYENNEDGLSDALKKMHKLQEHISQRDLQIHDLVADLNSTNEVVAENCILRKRLGIPEDEYVETKGLLAKQRKYAKINDRLVLKLRASEEMRLQLKIDKNDLRRKVAELELQPKQRDEKSIDVKEKVENQCQGSPKEIKHCDNCRVQYNVYESLKYCRSCIMKQNSNLCDNCMRNFKISSNENIELIKKITKLEIDHQNVSEENENLRAGLNEILEKLRNFENSSEQMIINPATLEKLLYILNLRTVKNGKEIKDIIAVPMRPVSSEVKVSADADEMVQLKMLVKELSEQNENITRNLNTLKLVEEQYNELVRSSELCDDDKAKLLISSLNRCHEIELNLKCYERKVNYLKNDNEALNNDLKSLKLEYLALISDVKREVLSKARTMREIKRNEEEEQNHEFVDVGELNAELQQIRSELNGLCFNIIKNVKTIDCENLLALNVKQLENVQLLENNLTSTFITRQEYETMKKQLLQMTKKLEDQTAREQYFEQLAKVTQSQLLSQQFLISQFSDEEISARHLIVDLQSQSNENYLLTKTQRDLNVAKGREEKMKMEIEQLKLDVKELEQKLHMRGMEMVEQCEEFKMHEHNNVLKIRYLKKTLMDLCNQFSSFTPVYLIADFVKNYVLLLELRKQQELDRVQLSLTATQDVTVDYIMTQLKDESLQVLRSDIEAKIEIIKYQSSCEYLKKQLELQESTMKELHNEIAQLKMQQVKSSQHWNAIRMLFNDNTENEVLKIEMKDKETQVGVRTQDTSTNTDVVVEVVEVVRRSSYVKEPITAIAEEIFVEHPAEEEEELHIEADEPKSLDYNQLSMESQLKKALILASSRSALLIDIENQLSEAQGRIKGLEKNVENREKRIQLERESQEPIKDDQPKKDDHILSITIATLQNLLLEKDTTMSRYQELLKSERQLHARTYDELTDEVKQLKKLSHEWESKLNEKCNIESKLRVELEELELKMLEQKKLLMEEIVLKERPEPRVTFNEHEIELRSMEVKLNDAQYEMKKLLQQLKDAHSNERQLENTVREKEQLIKELNLKMKATIDNYDALSDNLVASNEIDQLREMLEDKDKHIQDLTETLNQFHDDQQKYINDSALNSAEQVHHISADLNRADANNRILKTQLEALKRQITNIQQREKQAREMIKTLKNQLIRRPVISVKGDKRPNSQRDEQLQRKVQELDSELLDVKDELRRQININDNKRAKNAAELGLWDKQKRYQEMSEKLKVKLTEKEIDCERMKANLQIAKNNIMRLEKEKTMFENRMKSGRYLSATGSAGHNFCGTCSNVAARDTPVTSEASSTMIGNDRHNHELINVLKSRIESQQRRIISLELEGKGSNAIGMEVERLQDHVTAVESQNIRLEARNIQLQLDVDVSKQNDASERLVCQLKHLENYILVLKDELAQAHVQIGVRDGCSKQSGSESNHSMEQTILTMKRMIEKLRAENKYLKEVKSGSPAHSSSSSSATSTATYMNQTDRKKEELYGKLKMENEKLQKKFNEALDKISSLQIELELQQTTQGINVSCPHCTGKNLSELAAQGDADVLSQQLQQKSMLLDKAKMLLTRAAAKEKHLREQIHYMKKRVCELEGVPVISEENSEAG
ncbi:unnamed protein product [Diamesa serratosioi]